MFECKVIGSGSQETGMEKARIGEECRYQTRGLSPRKIVLEVCAASESQLFETYIRSGDYEPNGELM